LQRVHYELAIQELQFSVQDKQSSPEVYFPYLQLHVGAEIRVEAQVIQFLEDVIQVIQYLVLQATQFVYKPSS